jgi:hypothetical protein
LPVIFRYSPRLTYVRRIYSAARGGAIAEPISVLLIHHGGCITFKQDISI